MIDKIKEKIDQNRFDRQTYLDYIKSFVDCKEAKELFKDDEGFKDLIEEKKEDNKKEEDEYF